MAHKLYPKITFPINFSQIGLDYKMTYENFSDSENINVLRPKCQAARSDTIRCVRNPASTKLELVIGGKLQLNDGTTYHIRKTLASGAFGTTAIIQKNNNPHDLYCLKRQILEHSDDEIECYKEAMMHHILDIHTRPFKDHPSDLIPRLYHIARSFDHDNIYVYFIMDLMSMSLHNLLYNIPNHHDKLYEFVRCLSQIRPTLEILYTRGLYNHGDLHMGNVMYHEASETYKLIDYGFSRIRIGTGAESHMLVLNSRNDRSDASRDLTQLITAFELTNKVNKLQFDDGSFEHRVQQLIEIVSYNGQCSGLSHPDHTNNFVGHGWSASYRYFNTHTNVNGTYDVIRQLINQLPSSNAAHSSVSHKPSVSSSSSLSVSRAPRTPRPKASHEMRVDEYLGQINLLGPGCMLFYLALFFIGLHVASHVYHGKGGRDPTMNQFLLNHSNQPVAMPSKSILTNYPMVSFQPTYSMQMKPLSKNLSNNKSKTRSNRSNRSKQSLSLKKRNNTRRRSHKMIQATIEDFDKLSLASLYQYLRFHAFPSVSQKAKKEMLHLAAMVPLHRPDVFAHIVMAVQENNMDLMMEILQKNKIDMGKLGFDMEPFQELWDIILDAYFEEKDSPFELLQTLLHVGFQVDDFISLYHSADKETKKLMVMQTCIAASDYPENVL